MGRKKKNKKDIFMPGCLVWTSLAGIPKKMKWPGEIIRSSDGKVEVFCHSDNSW